jgi:hypothetical protein
VINDMILFQMGYTVEIFIDDKSEEIDITPALAGVALIGAYTERAEGIVTGNTLKITTKDSKEILTNRIKWSNKLEADVNLVLTNRKISRPGKEAPECYLYGIARVHGLARCAIINANKPDAVVTEVVAHEIGHLLEVPTGTFDRTAHCSDPLCIMSGTVKTKSVDSIVSTNIYTYARKLLGIPVTQIVQEYDPQTSFCANCSQKLQEQMAKLSSGIY